MDIGKIWSKKVSFFIVLVILLVIVGVFLFYVWKETKDLDKENEGELISSSEKIISGYQSKNIGDELIVENIDYGLSMKTSKEWVVEQYGAQLNIFSSAVALDKDGKFVIAKMKENGVCAISIEIEKCEKIKPELETQAEYVGLLIKSVKKDNTFLNKDNSKGEVILVDGKDALKKTFFKDGKEAYIEVQIPINDIIYSFATGKIYSDKCVKSFDDVMKTVVISK
jgi:hypothetical protein